MIISIGCDHAVTNQKDHMVKYLQNQGHTVIDNGTYNHIRTHYPIYGKKTADKVVSGEADLGIVICGTGVGISISANKVKGARAVLVRDVETARYAREELDANIISFGGHIVGEELMKNIVDVFLETEYKETEENKEIIKRINQFGNENQINNEELFDECIKK